MLYNGDLVRYHWLNEWGELHIYDHHQNSNGTSRGGWNSTGCTTWIHSQNVNREEELKDFAHLACLVVVNRQEDMERVWSVFNCRIQTESSENLCVLHSHSKSGEKRKISCHVNQTSCRGGIALRYIVLT